MKTENDIIAEIERLLKEQRNWESKMSTNLLPIPTSFISQIEYIASKRAALEWVLNKKETV